MRVNQVEAVTVHVVFAGAFSAAIIGMILFPTVSVPSTPSCQVEGMGSLELVHHEKIATLQETLTRIGSLAVIDPMNADRVRQEIVAENIAYQSAVKRLSITCE
jgi:hypothetical protein